MRRRLFLLTRGFIALALTAAGETSLRAVQVGQTRDDVVRELGAPTGKMETAGTEILRYRELTIRLKDGRVIAIDTYVPPARPAPPPPGPEAAAKIITPSVEAPLPPIPMQQYQSQKIDLQLPKHFVGMPSVETPKGWMIAGTAFLARRRNDSQIYILTAHHLFSPAGGLSGRLSHAELPTMVRSFQLVEWFGDPRTRPTDGCFVPDSDDSKEPLGDLALFKVSNVPEEDALLLAETSPAMGEMVWIVAQVKSGAPKANYVHRARVVPHNSRWLVCAFENSQISLQDAAGAPVVNAQSRIVGVYSGYGESNGYKYAFVIPSTLVLKTIREL